MIRTLIEVNEWQLQNLLTEKWVTDGVLVKGNRHFLVAREVMVPSWRINDPSKHWTEPSIDFLIADEFGRLGAVELKMTVPGERPAWRVLCQVTHRAVMLERTYSVERLRRAFTNAHSGRHGRVSGTDDKKVHAAHQGFFELNQPVQFRSDEMRRFVAATAFGPRFERVLERFNGLAPEQLAEELEQRHLLSRSRTNREPLRLIDAEPMPEELRSPAVAFTVDVP